MKVRTELRKYEVFTCGECGNESEDEFEILRCEKKHKQIKCDHKWVYDFEFDPGYYTAYAKLLKTCDVCRYAVEINIGHLDHKTQEDIKRFYDLAAEVFGEGE